MLTWVPSEHSTAGLVCIRTRMLTTERLEAVGIDGQKLALTAGNLGDGGSARDALSRQVRRRERKMRNPEDAAQKKQAEARRKRIRRVELDHEDRDRLRKLARSRDEFKLELEPTPEGLRETAKDSTPRSAKAAGLKLRKLTNTFYERLLHPGYGGVTHEELEDVVVKSKAWDMPALRANGVVEGSWITRTRRLQRCGGSLHQISGSDPAHHAYPCGFIVECDSSDECDPRGRRLDSEVESEVEE